MPPIVNPQPIAIVVCDNVYRDSIGKQALVGMFAEIVTANQTGPIIHPKLAIYVAFTEVYPGTEVNVRVINGETDKVITEARTVPSPPEISPTDIFEFVFEVFNVTFPDEGVYFIQLCANGETLLQRPISVKRNNAQEQTNDDN